MTLFLLLKGKKWFKISKGSGKLMMSAGITIYLCMGGFVLLLVFVLIGIYLRGKNH
jgi:hypothetical protein